MAKISSLRDDFEDGVIDTSLWTPTGTVSETGGRLVITPNGVGVFSQCWANSLYDLSQSSVTIQVQGITSNSSGTSSILELELDGDNRIAISKTSSDLRFFYELANSEVTVGIVTYNAVNHLYWRIRADSSNVYWETSATGTGTFFIQGTQNISSLFPVSALAMGMYSVYTTFDPSPGSFRIEAVNPGLQLTFSGASTSSGSLALRKVLRLSASGSSSSVGTLSWTIPPLTAHAFSATGISASSGSLSLIVKAPNQMLFVGGSSANGGLALTLLSALTFFGQSFATGSLSLTVRSAVHDPDAPIQYYTFEPPVVYDRPGVHSRTPRRVRQYAYYDNHSLGATGVSVLKLDGVYQSIYTPTADQIERAEYVYQGGHIYTIPQWEADALSSAGYPVTIIPITQPECPYPGMYLFPDEALYPCVGV